MSLTISFEPGLSFTLETFDLVIIGLAVLWYGTHWLYLVYATLKSMKRRGVLTGYWKYAAGGIVAMITGVVLDVLYNAVWGTWIFRELPKWFSKKELMFSGRVQRHVDFSYGWRQKKGAWYGHTLNAPDPNHIKRLPEE